MLQEDQETRVREKTASVWSLLEKAGSEAENAADLAYYSRRLSDELRYVQCAVVHLADKLLSVMHQELD